MQESIKNKLLEIEHTNNVKILYACETGSRAWGFPSPDSDYDVRIIYKHELDWYLSLKDKKDTIEYMSPNKELDVSGWDIKKCLKLMWKSNGALLERLQSPIVYREEQGIAGNLNAFAEKCFNPVSTLYHYLGMAKSSYSEIVDKDEIKLKKLFYALRATLACKWIIQENTIPPIVFIKMVDELSFSTDLKKRIVMLMTLKSGETEQYIHPAEIELTDFIGKELETASQAFNRLTVRRKERIDLDSVLIQLLKN